MPAAAPDEGARRPSVRPSVDVVCSIDECAVLSLRAAVPDLSPYAAVISHGSFELPYRERVCSRLERFHASSVEAGVAGRTMGYSQRSARVVVACQAGGALRLVSSFLRSRRDLCASVDRRISMEAVLCHMCATPRLSKPYAGVPALGSRCAGRMARQRRRGALSLLAFIPRARLVLRRGCRKSNRERLLSNWSFVKGARGGPGAMCAG
ncbi:hypothetical protein R3P38DRAFT_1551869 [Favolaschia claudopus]|uniref:Uncharacterized protein n=1 Tax=Favolaschia claudopus TaxID=2862362 RepID=A0AAW0AIC6_9AGAR